MPSVVGPLMTGTPVASRLLAATAASNKSSGTLTFPLEFLLESGEFFSYVSNFDLSPVCTTIFE